MAAQYGSSQLTRCSKRTGNKDMAAARRVLPPFSANGNDCFSSIRKQAICLYMPRLRIEGPRGVMASKQLALNWSVSLSW